MNNIESIMKSFDVTLYEQLQKYKSMGKKIIGSIPLLVPEELVYASGMISIGIWGSEGEITKAKQYFPAFYPSILQRTMDLGLSGELKDIEAIIIPALSDSLKALSQNWKVGVKDIRCLHIAYAQNRKIQAGLDFNEQQYIKLKKELEEISGNTIHDSKIEEAIKIFNNHRKVLMEFIQLASNHPVTIGPRIRSMIIESSYLMDKIEHMSKLEALNSILRSMPEETWNGKRIITTGLIANSKAILELFEKNGLSVVGDEVINESIQFNIFVDENTNNPIRALAKKISDVEGFMFLYDPYKKRADLIIEKVNIQNADGVVYLMTKFCDSDEFDYPIIRDRMNAEGIRNILIEVDQQMTNYEQAGTAIQTFADILQ